MFTRRRDDLRRHAGEISFPGGRQDPGEDLRRTALREAEEEIGLRPASVELVGALPPTPTVVTSYAIYPFVGRDRARAQWRLERGRGRRGAGALAARAEGRLRTGAPGPTRPPVPHRRLHSVDGALIWGATARILGDLFERLETLC